MIRPKPSTWRGLTGVGMAAKRLGIPIELLVGVSLASGL